MKLKTSVGLIAVSTAVLLAACGGGGGNDSTNQQAGSVVLSGQVVDSAIAGAKVCIFVDGVQARDAAGTALCSSETDAQGNYTITIPRNLNPGFLTLVATKGSDIKLAASLGTLAQVFEAAGSAGTVSPAVLPAARVTHFTTADFALADTNNDGTVSKAELDAYSPDFSKVEKVAAVIKAVIDFEGHSVTLIGGQTTNTLTLASAAGRGEALGTSNKTADQWFADPANAEVVAAVYKDVADTMAGRFSKYRFSAAVTSSNIPPTVTRTDSNGNVYASIYCGIGTGEDETEVEIAFDPARRIIVIKHEDGQIVGGYNPDTNAVTLREDEPRAVSLETAITTFYSEGRFNMTGVLNATTGAITGTFAESSTTTWTLDSTRQVCTAQGTFSATKL